MTKTVNSTFIPNTYFMKKILTVIAVLAVVLLVAFLIGGFLGPQSFKMERSIEIKAPKTAVFLNISDYRNWKKWSPWAEIDSNCKYEYYGIQGDTGAGYKWKGNDKVGEGDMHTIEMSDNSSLTSQLTFVKPFPSMALAGFKLESLPDGSTKVTWSFSQNYSFSQRPFMLLMNMEKMLGADYEKGLAKLKAACEKEASTQSRPEVKEVTWEAHTYWADRSVIDIKDVAQVFQTKMPKTFVYMQQHKIKPGEPASALFYTWDTAAGKSDLAIAIPLKGDAKAADGYSVITIARSKALVVDFYGPYDKTGIAHDALKKYIAEKGLKAKMPAIEEYITDPSTEKDPNKVLTKVYYLIEG